MFNVQKSYSDKPSKEIKGTWEKALPPNVGNFSATAYFFAKTIHNKLKIPIGIIHSSWGGTPAESWTSVPKLKEIGLFSEITDIFDKNNF